ncbi:MAG: hypothetical protein E7G49_06375 [Cutibacterium granulosum]|uniref:Cellulose synthase n=1 Tax=Cutibacterium granulosum DSM 20700 TaxID=1160719 RepID=U1F7N7_9ACTN|nr:hypothetical protein [Cutibacterium granulosum]ERF55443.1 hypothetical protein H641_08580 [Cutibacterium granulosum DSM 20700]MDU3768397.1 hypothetical protein [Cutibacterium granulosum]
MDETSIVILVTIITTVLPVLWAVFGWLARRSWRPVLRGLGLALVPIGLLVTGLMRLLVRALTLVVSWFAHTQMTTTIWTGVIVAAIGLLTWIGAGFMTPLTREEARQRRAEHRERRAAGAAGKPAAPTSRASQASQARTDKAPRTAPTASRRSGMSPEDEELEKILKDRGI